MFNVTGMEARFEGEVLIRHVRYANEVSGWAVIDAAVADGTPVAMVGPLVHLERGERVAVVGTWVQDPRYGRQVKVEQASPLPPDDPAALVDYLRRMKHVGTKRAADLVAAHGAYEVLDAVDADPLAAFERVGLRGQRAQEAAESWQSLRVTRRLHLLLAPHGLAYLASRIHEHYGPAAHEIVSRNPYELTRLFGVGFLIADRIALAGPPGPQREAQRARAAIMHVLATAERSGSTCLPVDELLAAAHELLGERPPDGLIGELAGRGDVVREDDWVYRTATAELERELAERVARLIEADPSERLVPAADRAPDSELTEEQLAAVGMALGRRLNVITGGPGTGKTATIKSIVAVAEGSGVRVMLVAPTGRAAASACRGFAAHDIPG